MNTYLTLQFYTHPIKISHIIKINKKIKSNIFSLLLKILSHTIFFNTSLFLFFYQISRLSLTIWASGISSNSWREVCKTEKCFAVVTNKDKLRDDIGVKTLSGGLGGGGCSQMWLRGWKSLLGLVSTSPSIFLFQFSFDVPNLQHLSFFTFLVTRT
jgi:hypothetical protein